MLSALAKYIFGGIMDDAPETTSMQYETREMNDWLLVDMPDQDIDNEDMDSESEDDDDILTAVPLLLAEEDSVSPRQIVLSYEANTSCDKSYAKIRKGASSKVQVHTGDKIQGNFIANVEAISLETGEICNDKDQHNLSDIQENTKPKQCKSKSLKPKKSKKNKNNKKLSAKIQDKPVIIKKKSNDSTLVKSNDPTTEKLKDAPLLDINEDIQSVSNEIPMKFSTETECRLTDKVEDSQASILHNSSHEKEDNVEDISHIAIINDCSHAKEDKIEGNTHTAIMDNSSHTREGNSPTAIIDSSSYVKEDKIEDNSHIAVIDNSNYIKEDNSHIAMIDNSNHRYQSVCDNFLENSGSKVQETIINDVPKYSDKKNQSSLITVENNFSNVSKRSYADVVKAKFDAHDKDSVDKICKNEPEFPEAFLHDKAQDTLLELKNDNTKPIPKKNKSKKSKNNKRQNESDIKSEDIEITVCVNHPDEFQKDVNGKRNFSNDTASKLLQEQQNFNNIIESYFNDHDISDTDKSNIKILDTSLAAYENYFEDVLENCTDKVEENFDDKSESEICEMQQSCEIIQDSFSDKEAVLIDALESFEERRLLDMSNSEGTEDIFARNLKYNNADFQNEDIQDFIDDVYFGPFPSNSVNENQANFMDNCQKISREVNDNVQQDSFQFRQSLDDTVLENIADLWDIYAKIQDNSDDEIHEISDDEMNENFHREIQIPSNREMNENSDEQITDDEINENLMDEYEELSDDELHGRYYGTLQKLFGAENGRLCSKMFEYSHDEESEESDGEMFTDIEDCLTLPSIKRMRERKPKLLQPFKCDFLEELKQNASEIPKHHSSCIPFAEYELVEYFNFEPQYFYACQSLQYPSSYALAIAEYYSNHDQYLPKYSERYNAYMQKYKRRAIVENQTPSALCEPSLITNSADILQKIINQKCSALPTKTAVVLEHVKDLKPVQQAIQYEARKYLTRSQLNRQNRNYIYQSSTKTNRRRNLQRNHSGVNNNRKCC